MRDRKATDARCEARTRIRHTYSPYIYGIRIRHTPLICQSMRDHKATDAMVRGMDKRDLLQGQRDLAEACVAARRQAHGAGRGETHGAFAGEGQHECALYLLLLCSGALHHSLLLRGGRSWSRHESPMISLQHSQRISAPERSAFACRTRAAPPRAAAPSSEGLARKDSAAQLQGLQSGARGGRNQSSTRRVRGGVLPEEQQRQLQERRGAARQGDARAAGQAGSRAWPRGEGRRAAQLQGRPPSISHICANQTHSGYVVYVSLICAASRSRSPSIPPAPSPCGSCAP